MAQLLIFFRKKYQHVLHCVSKPLQKQPQWGQVYERFKIPHPVKKNPDGVGFGIQLGHGSILFERALELLHATTIVKSPNVLDGQRSGLVLFRHFTRGQVNERFKMRALQKFASWHFLWAVSAPLWHCWQRWVEGFYCHVTQSPWFYTPKWPQGPQGYVDSVNEINKIENCSHISSPIQSNQAMCFIRQRSRWSFTKVRNWSHKPVKSCLVS